MASRRSPTARHRRLVAELSRPRRSSGLSRVEVAERIDSTDTTHLEIRDGSGPRRIGGPEVMREQLEHLVDLGRPPNAEIRFVPFSAGTHAATDGKFCLLGFPAPEDPDLVYLEQATSGLMPKDPEEVRRYTPTFGSLTALALGTEAPAAFLAQTARRCSSH